MSYSPPIFGGLTVGSKETRDTIIRFVQEQDIPVYRYHCKNTLQGDCAKPQCKFCLLALTGYLTTLGGNRTYIELPEKPNPRYSWLCTGHQEELCDKCDCFIEGKARFRVWEWDIKARSFITVWTDNWDPLLHGYFNRSLEKKELSERHQRAVKRNSTRKPYDSANSKARKTLAKLHV